MAYGQDDEVVGRVPISRGATASSDWGADDQVVKRLWQPFKNEMPQPVEQKKPDTPVPTLVEAGWEGLKGDVRTGAARLASGLGWDETSKYIQEQARKNYEEQARRPITDIDENLLKGIYEGAVTSLPSMAPVMAGGLAGGAAGTAVAGPLGTVAGSIIGGTAAALPLFFGSNLKRQTEEQKVPLEQTNMATAGGTALLQASLDSLLGGGLFGGAFKVPAAIAQRTVARAATKALEGVATESLTEGAQQWLEVLQANPEKAKSMPKEVWKEVIDSMIIGGAMGGVAGGVAGIPKPKETPTPEPYGPPAPTRDQTELYDPAYNYPANGGPVMGPLTYEDWERGLPGPRQPYGPPSPGNVDFSIGPKPREGEPAYIPNGTGFYKTEDEIDFPEMRMGPGFPDIAYPEQTHNRVYEDVKAQALAAGEDPDVAENIARLQAQKYETYARYMGIDAETLYRANKLEIRGPNSPPEPKPPLTPEQKKKALNWEVSKLRAEGVQTREAILQAEKKLGFSFKEYEQQGRSFNQTPMGDEAKHYPLLLSALARAPMKTANGITWRKWLERQGIKNEEMEWSTIGDLLSDDANTRFSPEQLADAYMDFTPKVDFMRGNNAPYGHMTLGGMGSDPKHNYRIMTLSLPQLGEMYSGGHWAKDTMNVVAHGRLTDTTTPDGKTVTINNEFQSDPHQKARDAGYRAPAKEAGRLVAEEFDARDKLTDMIRDSGGDMSPENIAWVQELSDPSVLTSTVNGFAEAIREVVVSKYGEEVAKAAEGVRELTAKANRATKGVTNMPFKETWPNLLFRQGLMDAINNGKDYFAWPTGEQETVIQGHQGSEKHEKAHKLFMDKRLVDYATKLGKPFGAKPEKIKVKIGNGAGAYIFDKSGGVVTVRDPVTRHFIGEYDLRDNSDIRDFKDQFGAEAYRWVNSKESGKHFYDPSNPTYLGKTLSEWRAQEETARNGLLEIFDQYAIEPSMALQEIRENLTQAGLSYSEQERVMDRMYALDAQETDAFPALDFLENQAESIIPSEKEIWALPITPQMRELVKAGGFPLYQHGLKEDSTGRMNNTPQGNITFLPDKTIIRLFKSKNASTLLHEFGHLGLEEMIRLAPHSRQIAFMLSETREFLGNKGEPFTTEQHEKFARAFEKYLATSKAPTPGLREVFKMFANWLKKIYGKAVDLNVEITPQIQRVFDMMFQTTERAEERATPTDIVVGKDRTQGVTHPQANDTNTQAASSFKKQFDAKYAGKYVSQVIPARTGDSTYFTFARKDANGKPTPMKMFVRFGSHAQYHHHGENVISIDDITKNTPEQVMKIVDHFLTGEGSPPRIGLSFLDPRTQAEYRVQATYSRERALRGLNPFAFDPKDRKMITPPGGRPGTNFNQTPMGDEDPKIRAITDRMNALIMDFHTQHPQFRDLRVGGSFEWEKLYAWRNSPMGKEHEQLQAERYALVRASGMTMPQYNAKYGRPLNIRSVLPDVAADRQIRKGQSRWITNADGSITQRDEETDDDSSGGRTFNQTPGAYNPRNPRVAQNPIRKGLGWFQKVFNPFSQLDDPDSYRNLRNLASGGTYAATQAAKKAKAALSGLTPADREKVNQYMETKGADPLSLPPQVREEAVKLKKYINGPLKRSLVDAKLISQAAADKYDDAYLPRLYLKYLAEGEGFQRGARLSQKYAKQRTSKTEDELLAMGEVRDPAIRAFMGIFRPMRDLAMIDFLRKVAGTTDKNWVVPQSLIDWDGHMVTPQWLKAEAEAIRTVRSKAEADPDRVKAMLDVAQRMENKAVEALDFLNQADYDVTKYKAIPDNRDFGPMRGMIVRKEIHDDITGAVNFVKPDNWFDKFFGDRQSVATKAISFWKFAKVPLNPPSQVRNIISNMMLLNLSGIRIDQVVPYMVKAAKDMRADGKYFNIAKKYGVGVGTFNEQELYAITDELQKLEGQADNGFAGWKAVARLGLRGANKVGDWYQIMEVWGKVAKIMHEMEKNNLSEDAAVREANKWLFDYSEVPQWVRRARQSPIGYPFITFTYKMLPLMAEVLKSHKTRLLPWVALAYITPAMVAAVNDIDDDDPEKLRKALPPALRKYNDMYLLPWKDSDGRWQFVNIGYFLPWQMPLDIIRNLGAAGEASLSGDQRKALAEIKEAGAATNILSNPLFNLVTAITTGIDPFSGKPIADKRDTARQQVMDILSYTAGLMLPTLVSPFGAAGMALRDQTGSGLNRFGEPGPTGGQMAARAVGLNVYPVVPQAQRARNIQQMQREIQDIRSRMTYSLRDQSLTAEQRRRLASDFTDEIKDRVKQLQKYMKESELGPKVRAQTLH